MSSMDTTDNEKPLPEKSSSFGSRGADDIDDSPHGKSPLDDDQPDPTSKENDMREKADQSADDQSRISKEIGMDNPSPGPENDQLLPAGKINEEAEKPTLTDAADQEPSPLPPDLGKLSEEIDQYISSLSSRREVNIHDNDHDHDGEINSGTTSVPIFVEQFAVLFEAKIEDYDSSENPVKWGGLTDDDAASFLEAVNRLSKLSSLLSGYSSDFKYAYSINRIGSVLQRAMSYLEEEFRSLSEDYKIPLDDHDHPDHPPPAAENDQLEAGAAEEQPPRHPSSTASDDAASSDNVTNDPATSQNDHNNNGDGNNSNNNNAEKQQQQLGYSEEALSEMSRLAKAMVMGGCETECCQVYFIARRNALEETLHKYGGFEKHSIDDVQKMNWESVEREIEAWIRTLKQCTTVQFSRERKISDAVFGEAGHPEISEALFSSLIRGVVVQLLNFSEAVAMSKRAAEKLFKFLDIYETLRDVLPNMDNGLLPPQTLEEIKSEASFTRSRLGEAMICIFCELENSIKTDSGKTPVPGGAVHPLTRYTMNYLKYACEYKETLEQVFREHQKIDRADDSSSSSSSSGVGSAVQDHMINSSKDQQQRQQNNANNNNFSMMSSSSPFQVQVAKVMDLLDANLEAKSKLYKDLSLSWIFLMNNGRYILQKIRGSGEINSLMGDTWCRKRSSELRQYHKNYQRETWGKPLNCLMNHEGLNINGKVAKPVLKERFKSFNAMFDEIHKAQSTWVVSDEQLQSELRVSISNMVIPAYRAFMARYGQHLTPGRQTEKYVKYQPEDIETYVDELFDGNAATPTGRRKL